MKMRRVIAAATVLALVGSVSSALAARQSHARDVASDIPTKKVIVKDNFFDPRSLTIRPGTRVKWVWRGENPHNVTFVKVPRGASKRGADSRKDGHFTRT